MRDYNIGGGRALIIALGISALVILMAAYTGGAQAVPCIEIVQVSTSPIGLSPQPSTWLFLSSPFGTLHTIFSSRRQTISSILLRFATYEIQIERVN